MLRHEFRDSVALDVRVADFAALAAGKQLTLKDGGGHRAKEEGMWLV
jgi:hypothetical protein